MLARAIVSLLVAGVTAANAFSADEPIRVDVYVKSNNWTAFLGVSQMVAADLFKHIGVRVDWKRGSPPPAPQAGRLAVAVQFVDRAGDDADPNALAAARPFGAGIPEIVMYGDRLQAITNRLPYLVDVLIGYALAHELGHVLEGTGNHAQTGIMRANWTHADHLAMYSRRLRFTAADAERIRNGVAPNRWSANRRSAE